MRSSSLKATLRLGAVADVGVRGRQSGGARAGRRGQTRARPASRTGAAATGNSAPQLITTAALERIKAQAEIEDGRFGDAAAAARRSIALLERIGRSTTPGYFNAWGVLAQALRDGGRPLDAERAHGADGRFDPATDAALLPLRSQYALTLVQLQRHDKAVPLLDQLIEVNLAEENPTQARYMLLHKAYAMIDLGRLDKARQSLARAEPLFAVARAKHQPQARSMSLAIAHWAVAAKEWNQAQASIDESRALLERPPGAPEWVWRPLHRLSAQLALGR